MLLSYNFAFYVRQVPMHLRKTYIKIKYPGLFFARLYYFAYMGGWGFILPFTNLFYTSLGLNGKQIGTIASTSAMVGLLAAPVMVSTIKKHPKSRLFLQLILVWGAIGYFLLGQQVAFLPVIMIVILQSLAISSVTPISDSMAVSGLQ